MVKRYTIQYKFLKFVDSNKTENQSFLDMIHKFIFQVKCSQYASFVHQFSIRNRHVFTLNLKDLLENNSVKNF